MFQLLGKLQAFKALYSYFVFKQTGFHFYFFLSSFICTDRKQQRVAFIYVLSNIRYTLAQEA